MSEKVFYFHFVRIRPFPTWHKGAIVFCTNQVNGSSPNKSEILFFPSLILFEFNQDKKSSGSCGVIVFVLRYDAAHIGRYCSMLYYFETQTQRRHNPL